MCELKQYITLFFFLFFRLVLLVLVGFFGVWKTSQVKKSRYYMCFTHTHADFYYHFFLTLSHSLSSSFAFVLIINGWNWATEQIWIFFARFLLVSCAPPSNSIKKKKKPINDYCSPELMAVDFMLSHWNTT